MDTFGHAPERQSDYGLYEGYGAVWPSRSIALTRADRSTCQRQTVPTEWKRLWGMSARLVSH